MWLNNETYKVLFVAAAILVRPGRFLLLGSAICLLQYPKNTSSQQAWRCFNIQCVKCVHFWFTHQLSLYSHLSVNLFRVAKLFSPALVALSSCNTEHDNGQGGESQIRFTELANIREYTSVVVVRRNVFDDRVNQWDTFGFTIVFLHSRLSHHWHPVASLVSTRLCDGAASVVHMVLLDIMVIQLFMHMPLIFSKCLTDASP